ncbi:MAG TPA: DUF1646 family protein, partial [Candidatus Binataceae bacterium]|nr:DUF1646 family protein [Candidatus Binataceae bacterium]
FVILGLLLLGPLVARPIEENLEIYCLLLGVAAVTLAGNWNWAIAQEALWDPVPISAAVIGAGGLFRYGREYLRRALRLAAKRFPHRLLTALIVAVVALVSSIITSIVAALIMVEALQSLHLPKRVLTRVTVVGCMAIGLGASLTPLGEPLSTIAVDELNLEFFGLFTLLAPYVLPGIIGCAILAAFFSANVEADFCQSQQVSIETVSTIVLRGIKVFGFIAGLVLLGDAYAPLASVYLKDLSAPVLFWVNVIGAALDNATVVAIEIHGMPIPLAREVILSLLASGAMLIQGNIPNIIAAGALSISAKQWARIGIPLGLTFLIIYFLSLRLV